ncbi:SDR family oxidoreductase [Amycolatopsis regifaucium]|uniref:Short-chain dehydrogenase n=1 Tax=Amycolatopsis regifaucium TaxID=546365 RepID=A0A154MNU8_9PSEU|nr:SDR family oxidoreductase [Amycolatopsis regifaucium]KZB85988.1 short-chain dehydrogenase [Amycolatopsis regifaucium]OKA04878.1 short-chain dehydrogenase [Amycolatopsis regifaucium]SFH73818.1 7-alpha-hydroxysteroid dehydrogenase [Amycolatopsis regifaucium]
MILDRFRLDGKVAVVTGAGRGIGAACAIALAEVGADVVLAARTQAQLLVVAEEVRRKGRRAHLVCGDLSDPDAGAALAGDAEAEFGRIDVVINNLGGGRPGPLGHSSTEALEKAFRFNVSTADALTRAAADVMLRGDGGAIVNISSVVGRVAGRGFLAYGTAKAALTHYTRLSAADLSPRVRVNAVAPGIVLTVALQKLVGEGPARERAEASTPLRRIGDPQDVAAAVLYLATDASAYLTGKVIEVDGGLHALNIDLDLPDL